MDKMVIGIVGGMGSYATVDFFKRLVNAFPGEKEWDRPRIIIDNNCTMPSRVRAILYNERKEELINELCNSVSNLIAGGATHIILACNTSHVFLPDIINRLSISKDKFIHIIDACSNDVKKDRHKEVRLIASEGTIETGIYDKFFEIKGIKVNAPEKKNFEKLRDFIEVVKQDKISEEVLCKFLEYIESFDEDAVILGCTELPILYEACLKSKKYTTSKKIYDPLQSAIEILKMEFHLIREV